MTVENPVSREDRRNFLGGKRGFFRALAPLLLIFALTLLAQVSGSIAEASQDTTTTTQTTEPAVTQSVPDTELRDEKKGELTVNVQNLEDVIKVLSSSVPNRLEANVQPLTTGEVEKYGFRPNQGVVIIWLDPKGPLGRAGLATSDIILQVDNQSIDSLENFISLVDALGTFQPATFSVLDHRTGRIRNVKIVVGAEHRLQQPRGNFLSRQVEAAVVGIKKTARTVEEHVSYAAEKSKEAITTVIQGLKKWAGMIEKGSVAAVKKGGDTSTNPRRPVERGAGGPG